MGERTEIVVPTERQSRERKGPRSWIEKMPKITEPKVSVIYYLSYRHGQLEHPHFMEVPLSSLQGLFLRDVINRLNFLRGEGFAKLYSWSSKRSYKNGFVWRDLSDNDFIYPSQGHEYILKGSQLLETSLSFRYYETSSSSSGSKNSSETNSSSIDSNVIIKRRNQSWSSLDEICQYQVYKAKAIGNGANASTQTDNKGRRGGRESEEGEECEGARDGTKNVSGGSEENSLASSNSSFGRLGSLERPIKDHGLANLCRDPTIGNSGRRNASAVLMQLIRCWSRKINDME